MLAGDLTVMARIIVGALILTILGLAVGYGIFGTHPITEDYLPLDVLWSGGKGLNKLVLKPALEGIRQNILIGGAIGLVVGILTGALLQRKAAG
jgi:hypothetical protein